MLVHRRKFLLFPEYWEEPNNFLPAQSKWHEIEFKDASLKSIPLEKGIYCFVVKPRLIGFFETNYLFYLGKTSRTLQKRYSEYLSNQKGKNKPRPKIFEMLTLYKEYLHFYYTELKTDAEVDDMETRLLNAFIPHINTDIPNAKIKNELKRIYEA